MPADGSVVINASMDDKEAQAKLRNLEGAIEKTKAALEKKTAARDAISQELDAAKAKADEARKSVEYFREELAAAQQAMQPGATAEDYIAASTAVDDLTPRLAAAEKEAAVLDRQAAGVQTRFDRAAQDVQTLETNLADAQHEAGALQASIASTPAATKAIAGATARIEKGFARVERRIKGLVKQIFVFTLISAALRGMRTWLSNVIKTNDEASAALARLKGALLTLMQPLVSVIIPAFTTLVNVLTRIVALVARFVSMLFGKTLQESAAGAKQLQTNIAGAGKAAKKSMAAFDEINQISTQDESAGGGAAGAIAPDFSFDTQDEMTPRLKAILSLVGAIGAAFAAWKIGKLVSDVFQLGLGFKQLALIALFAASAFLIVWGVIDALKNGLNGLNLTQILVGITGALTALYFLLGATAAAIGAIVAGVGLAILAVIDMNKNGVNLYNTLGLIAAILLAGLGIAALTGSWIPLLIAWIAAVVLALVALGGNGQELFDTFKQIIGDIAAAIKAFMAGDFDTAIAHMKRAFAGIGNLGIIIAEGVVNGAIRAINWLIEKVNSLLAKISIPKWIRDVVGADDDWRISIPTISWRAKLPRIEIPALAQGAVVPPNREFMAMLGDNTQEPEVVSPLSTMRQAMIEALQAAGFGNGETTVVLEIDGQEFGKVVYKANRRESQRIGVRLSEV